MSSREFFFYSINFFFCLALVAFMLNKLNALMFVALSNIIC